MSSGIACRCKGPKEERMKNWEVLQYMCNHSAFNGYHYTRSEYSFLHCTACHMVWRTKASYVTGVYLGHYKEKEPNLSAGKEGPPSA